MGNACECVNGDNDAMTLVRNNRQFVLDDYQTKFVPASFQHLPSGEKDKLLSEVIRIIIHHGDMSTVSTANKTIAKLIEKSVAKIAIHNQHRKDCDGQYQEVYDGEVVDGVASGRGRVEQHDGSVYEGTFVGGYKRGRGFIHHHDKGTVLLHHSEEGVCQGPVKAWIKQADLRLLYFVAADAKQGPIFSEHKKAREFALHRDDRMCGLRVVLAAGLGSLELSEYVDGKQAAVFTYFK